MPQKLSRQDSDAIYFVKAMAIMFVVGTHTNTITLTTSADQAITYLWDMICGTCIGCFMIVGGFLYTRAPGDGARFWKRKAQTILLPWFFCATLTYLYRWVCGYEWDTIGYLKHLFGVGSWYYYATVYTFFLAVFKLIWNRPWALWLCVLLTAVKITLNYYLISHGLPLAPVSEYLHPIHWCGFFALGILLRRRTQPLGKGFLAGCAAVFLICGAVVYRYVLFNMFNLMQGLFTTAMFFLLFRLGQRLSGTKAMGFFRFMASSTYCIFLLHMPIVQAVARRIPESLFKSLTTPLICTAVMLLLIAAGKWITGKRPFGAHIQRLVGLR